MRFLQWFQIIYNKLRPYRSESERLGRKGERAATKFLKRAGYHILNRNWRSGHYELDIVAQIGPCVAFIEVRGRCTQSLQSGYDTINRTKKQALSKAVRTYLKQHRWIHSYRFDIISIDWDANGKISDIRHYESVPLR